MSVYSSQLLQPQGAYAELSDLLRLRHVAASLLRDHTANGQLNGHFLSRELSRGMEFEEVRQYQPGDDVRSIDWRVTARTQTTHTKRYRDEKEKPVITLVDQRRSLFFGSRFCFKSVYACHLAALINWATLARGDRAGGIVMGSYGLHDNRPARNHRDINRWLQQLLQANQQLNSESTHREPELSEGLQQLLRVSRHNANVIIITDAYDLSIDCEQWLFQLARQQSVSLYWLYDPLEYSLPLLPQLTVTDGQHRQTLTINKPQQALHKQAFMDKQRFLKKLCHQYRIHYHPVVIDEPLSQVFLDKSPRRTGS